MNKILKIFLKAIRLVKHNNNNKIVYNKSKNNKLARLEHRQFQFHKVSNF